MNILTIATKDLFGARFNGFALTAALRARGHRAQMAVWNKESAEPWVLDLRRGGRRLAQAAWTRGSRATGMQGLVSPLALSLPRLAAFRAADVVHVHLVEEDWLGELTLPGLARRKPLVWTVHSALAATGGCYHPFACERWRSGCRGLCPQPRGGSPLARVSPALHWQVKRRAYRDAPITLVAGSRWVGERLAQSPLTAALPRRLIPYGLDLGAFRPSLPDERAATRAALGIPADAAVVAFRGGRLAEDRYKGMRWLRAALERMAPAAPVHALVIQEAADFVDLPPPWVVHPLGWVGDERRLSGLLGAADLFLMPSLAESFGMMAAEAMASGTPAVVGEGTALVDVVQPPRGGVAVPSGDVPALAATIAALLADPPHRQAMAAAARRIAEAAFDFDRYVTQHLELYEELSGQG